MKTITTTIETIDNEEIITISKSKSRALRRKNNVKKAIRKRNIDKSLTPSSDNLWYNNLHQYSKNKIHCSCPLCSFNNKKKKYKSYTISDRKKIDSMKYQEKLYRVS